MILEMDIGNTRSKWRVLDQHGVRIGGNAAFRSLSIDEQLDNVQQANEVSRIRVSSVAGAEFDGLLSAALQSRFGVRAQFAA